MRGNERGRIIFMGSTTGMFPLPETVAYATAKAGLIGLTRSLALELAPYTITVNHIASGFVSTSRTLGEGEKLIEEVLSRQKIKTLATPQDIIKTMNYIIQTPVLTGATIAINGGEYMY
jgi:3-oxoacyl-[acyl-carrier protein] reductase